MEKKNDIVFKIKENVEDFIVQEVVNDIKCTIQPIIDLDKFKIANSNLEAIDTEVELDKEERKQIYDIVRYHPFKSVKTVNGKLSITEDSTENFVFTFLKYNYSDQAAKKLLARRLGVSQASIQTAGTKDKKAITLQEVSVKCNFERLFNYAFSLSKNKKTDFPFLGYSKDVENINNEVESLFQGYMKVELFEASEELGIYNIRRGGSKMMGDLTGNYFMIRIRNFSEPLESVSKKFYNYFGLQRFGNNLNNHIIGEKILNEKYDEALEDILADFKGDAGGYLKRKIESMIEKRYKAKQIINSLERTHLMIYLHSYQSYLFNKCINDRIKSGNPDPVVDKVLDDDKLINCTGTENLDEIYLPLEKMKHKFLKGAWRKMVEEISEVSISTEQENTVIKFFLKKSCYATIALREIVGEVSES
ncbi:hypothetical protein GINT2_000440 [Glugoides intestinalis]